MLNKNSFFEKKYIKELLDFSLASDNNRVIYDELTARDSLLKEKSFMQFSAEFVPAKLALGCVFWRGACALNEINDKDVENFFFKEALNIFASPKSLDTATKFSESLYASNANPDESPTVSVMVHLFHKLGISATTHSSANPAERQITEAFQFAVGVCDAMKNAFEELFDEFYILRFNTK